MRLRGGAPNLVSNSLGLRCSRTGKPPRERSIVSGKHPHILVEAQAKTWREFNDDISLHLPCLVAWTVLSVPCSATGSYGQGGCGTWYLCPNQGGSTLAAHNWRIPIDRGELVMIPEFVRLFLADRAYGRAKHCSALYTVYRVKFEI
jgi:hypothetical protein